MLYSSVDDYFKKAETYWEKLINTKKESQVGSSRWKDYKVILITLWFCWSVVLVWCVALIVTETPCSQFLIFILKYSERSFSVSLHCCNKHHHFYISVGYVYYTCIITHSKHVLGDYNTHSYITEWVLHVQPMAIIVLNCKHRVFVDWQFFSLQSWQC